MVVALRDPNPLVAGRGLALLRRGGVVVDTGVLAREVARLNEPFLTAVRDGRPFVLLKAAHTLDGRIATASGHSKWVTSAGQRRQARWLRRLYDAVLVGIDTVLADDPLLLPSPRTRRPFTRVVLDTSLRLPPTSRLAAKEVCKAGNVCHPGLHNDIVPPDDALLPDGYLPIDIDIDIEHEPPS